MAKPDYFSRKLSGNTEAGRVIKADSGRLGLAPALGRGVPHLLWRFHSLSYLLLNTHC